MHTPLRTLTAIVLLSAWSMFGAPGAASINLAGTWRFAPDPEDKGLSESWAGRELPYDIRLPGSLPQRDIGDKPSLKTKWIGGIQNPHWFTDPLYSRYTNSGNFKFPFWLQPERYYAGAAWFQREVEIPRHWSGKRVVLTLERPHWETQVWLDGTPLGTNRSLSTPHVYDLGARIAPGKHVLTIRVDNRMVVDVGENSHCVSDHTQGNWNGLVGALKLEATPLVWISDLQVFPNVREKKLVVRGQLGNAGAPSGTGKLRLRAHPVGANSTGNGWETLPIAWNSDGGTFEHEFPVALPLWDEFSPALSTLTAELLDFNTQKSVSFGFREISIEGTQFLVNGRKTFFRGTLECCIFPKTGHPPTDVGSWRKIYTAAKAHGLNQLRFHSYCPPEAAFIAADEMGMYLQVETCWANQTTTIGDGKPVDQWVYDETDRILQAYGNHPSFVLMAYGNEPGGAKANAYLARYVRHFRSRDSRCLWTSGAGWPQLQENEFHVTPDPRIQAWGAGLQSRINALPPETVTDYRDYIQQRPVPVISHEIGQWCVYPNFEEIKKYTGYLKPRNFEIFRDSLKANGMLDQAEEFLIASGKLQALCYKEDIESALRTKGMGGFQLLDLHDFPGQGTALVGILDPFWEQKGYITPAEFSRFCNSTVPLARLHKRVFTTAEKLVADIEVAHFGPAALKDVTVNWKIMDRSGNAPLFGRMQVSEVPVDNGVSLGTLQAELRALKVPAQYKLLVSVAPRAASTNTGWGAAALAGPWENDWDIWVYPEQIQHTSDAAVKVVHELDAHALETLKQGGSVLLAIPPAQVKGDAHGKVALGFSSIFWNTAWTGRQPPHTLGILCDPRHPLFAEFPTESHSNWQWWYIISRSGAMILDDLPRKLRPQIQVVDDWFTNRKLGLLFEASVGKGRLLVTSVDIGTGMEDKDQVIAQFRRALFNYMAGPKFKPDVELKPDAIRRLMTPLSPAQKLGAKVVNASSAQQGFEPENILDGNPDTMWHSRWENPPAGFPHELTIALSKPAAISAVGFLPRQDANRNGWIKDYEIYLSNNWQKWGKPAATGQWSADKDMKLVRLDQAVEAQFIRLVAKSGHASGAWASVAEFDLRIAE